MSSLPPIPRPVPWTWNLDFLPVSAVERASLDLAAKASFNVLCQDCKSIPSATSGPPASNAPKQIDENVRRKINLNQLCKSAAKGCHLCTLLLREVSVLGTSDENHFKDETPVIISMENDGHQLILTSGCGRDARSTLLSLNPSVTSEPHELPCSSVFTGSDECIQRCKLWLQQCLVNHPKCRHRTPAIPPTRLVEILGSREIRLVEPTTSMPYFALSYRWGGGTEVLLTKTTSIEQFRTSIPFEDLALTIQDAIGIAYKLGARHIWIDSLCILQDDAQDWAREAKSMCDVYQNATLTISALGATHATDGLFSRRDPLVFAGSRFPASQQHMTDITTALLERSSSVEWSTYFDASALQSRGWAFQERVLSPRILHFGSTLFWECGSSCKHETDTSILERKPSLGFKALLEPDPEEPETVALEQWARLVAQFTKRDLTIATDRLPAISGLITHFERRLDWTNIFGLWKEHLVAGLLWRVKLSAARQPRLDSNTPTWSWTSVQSPVYYPQARPPWNQAAMHGKINIDELKPSAINVHSAFMELTPCESGDPGESWFNMPTISLVDGKQTTTLVEWDTIETKFASLFFAPLLGTVFKQGMHDRGDYGWLTGPVVYPDPVEPRTYRRCGYSSFKMPSGFDGLTEFTEKFRLV
jgi:hypothetical protein